MKDVIKFLAPIADGKLNPALGFIRLAGNVAQAGNQAAFVQMNCETGVDIAVKADRALSAMNSIKGDVVITEKDDSVIFSGGGVRVKAQTIPVDDFPRVEPKGDIVALSGDLIGAISVAKQFSADGDVREYLNGVALAQGKAMASDGHCGAMLDGVEGIECILPQKAVDLLIKIGEQPDSVQHNPGFSITFHYQWGWVRCNVIDAKYPSQAIIDAVSGDCSMTDASVLSDAVSTIKGVTGVVDVVVSDGKISGDDAISIDADHGLPCVTYKLKLLSKMLAVSDSIHVPAEERKPAIFGGANSLRGFVMPTIK